MANKLFMYQSLLSSIAMAKAIAFYEPHNPIFFSTSSKVDDH
jgi:hypothetical protein